MDFANTCEPGENFYRFNLRGRAPADASAFHEASNQASGEIAAIAESWSANESPAAAFYQRLRSAANSTDADASRELDRIEALNSWPGMVAYLARPESLVRGPIRFVFGGSGDNPPRRMIHIQPDHAWLPRLFPDGKATPNGASSFAGGRKITRRELDKLPGMFPWTEALEAAGINDNHTFLLWDEPLIMAFAQRLAELPLKEGKAILYRFAEDTATDLNRSASPSLLAAKITAFHFPDAFGDFVESRRRGLDLAHRLFFQLRERLLFLIRATLALPEDDKARAVQRIVGVTLIIAGTASDSSCVPVPVEGGLAECLATVRGAQWRQGVKALEQPWPVTEATPALDAAAAEYNDEFNCVFLSPALLSERIWSGDDAATNHGALGAIIGHELAHALVSMLGPGTESPGAREWWRAQCEIVASRRPVASSIPDGCVVEDLCDRLGLELAWIVFAGGDRTRRSVDEVRRFFLAWANLWQGFTPAAGHGHATGELRTNERVRDFEAWHRAFEISPHAPLYLKPDERWRSL